MIAGITSSGQTQLDLYGAGLSFVKDIGGMSHASHVQWQGCFINSLLYQLLPRYPTVQQLSQLDTSPSAFPMHFCSFPANHK